MNSKIFWAGVCMILAAGTISAQRIESIFDDSFDRSGLDVKRVAIIPNRLPLVLQEPEMWRYKNWEILAGEFQRHGYEVLDYDRSMDVAYQAKLPLEDTLSSEEKYAEFCRLTGTDLLVMPYYGTGFTSSNYFLLATRHNFISTVSFQYYTPRENIFFHRADASARTGYTSGLGMVAGLLTTLAGAFLAPEEPTIAYIGSGIMLAGTLWDTIRGMKPAESWWEEGFQNTVPVATAPLLGYLGGGAAEPLQKMSSEKITDSAPHVSQRFAEAQNKEKSAMQFGIKGGAGFNIFQAIDYKFSPQFAFGAYADIALSSSFSLQPELILRGVSDWFMEGRYTSTIDGYYEKELEGQTSATALEIPILLKLKFSEGSASRLYLYTGPSLLTALTDVKIESEGYEDDNGTVTSLDGDKEFPADNSVFSVLFGFGVENTSGNNRFDIELRGGLGLSDMFSEERDYTLGYYLEIGLYGGYGF